MIQSKQKQIKSLFDEAGFTIVESLVALIVAGLLLAAVAPALVVSTATRVQARRIELATQASRTFIDGLKSGAVDATKLAVVEIDLANSKKLDNNLISSTEMPPPSNKTGLFCIGKDANNFLNASNPNCTSNLFYIQATQVKVKGVKLTNDNGQLIDSYVVALRVYRSDFENGKATASNETKSNSAKTFTGGLGDKNAPLVETTTVIASRNTSFNALCQRLNTGISGTNPNCN